MIAFRHLLIALGALMLPMTAQAQNATSGSPRVQGVPAGYGDPVQVVVRAADGSAPAATHTICDSGCSGGGGGGDATAANQTTQITAAQLTNTTLGAVTASPTSNTIGDRLKVINTTLGSPFQAGGSIGNTTFAATQSGTWNITNVSGTVSLPTGASTAANQSTANTSLAAIATSAAAATPAGELHVGEVGGNIFLITSTQTVTASSAYTSGNAIGGLMTLSNAARVSGSAGAPGTSGLLQSVIVNSKSAQTTQVDIFIFDANPSGSTCTDKTAISVAAADFAKIIGVASIPATTGWFSGGTPSLGQVLNLAMPYALLSSTTLYACAVTRATPTFTATTDISIGFRVLRN